MKLDANNSNVMTNVGNKYSSSTEVGQWRQQEQGVLFCLAANLFSTLAIVPKCQKALVQIQHQTPEKKRRDH